MVRVSAEVKGLKKLQRNMEKLIKDLSGSLVLQAIAKSTLLVQRQAKKNAPVDTGRLRASITPEVVRRDTVIRGIVGSNVKYAPFQEAGTRFMKGKWYLRRALRENRDRIRRIMGAAIKKLIKGQQ